MEPEILRPTKVIGSTIEFWGGKNMNSPEETQGCSFQDLLRPSVCTLLKMDKKHPSQNGEKLLHFSRYLEGPPSRYSCQWGDEIWVTYNISLI